ncbi:hypothetical protein [Luteitalea sp.]|uniref:hypothetical protein n=1 Tax=Luteitalea sp. TaxID=2004800 RepID=UPI0025C2CBD5|nr:hypothetical protein [Luteitalea sp.]
MRRMLLTILAVLIAAVMPATAQDFTSPTAAQTLLRQMDASQADALAVRDPDRPERFIAALRLPGQLLVVSATHPSVDLVAQRLEGGDYRGVYLDLQGTPAQASKFFVHDMEADGLAVSGRGDAYDMIYDAGDSLACNGRWKDAKLDKDEYRDRIAKADARYARLLSLLARAPEAQVSSR